MKSVIALSMHKAGSIIADRIIEDFCALKGYEIDRIASKVPGSPLSEVELYRSYQSQMATEGVYYGVARQAGTHDMEILPKLRIIAQVRDPRDCITSAYFSFRDSHVPPSDPEKLKAFEERRKKLNTIEIDDYAVAQARDYLGRLRKLNNIVNEHDDLLLLKYEDMVENTDRWLQNISDFIEQPVTPELLERLGGKINFKVSGEDTSRHKRQVTPGDHKRKLKSETIKQMNDILAEGLETFKYEL